MIDKSRRILPDLTEPPIALDRRPGIWHKRTGHAVRYGPTEGETNMANKTKAKLDWTTLAMPDGEGNTKWLDENIPAATRKLYEAYKTRRDEQAVELKPLRDAFEASFMAGVNEADIPEGKALELGYNFGKFSVAFAEAKAAAGAGPKLTFKAAKPAKK